MNEILKQFVDFYIHPGVIVGLVLELILFSLLILGYSKFRKSNIIVLFELGFEKVYAFFEDILGIEEKKWIKLYVTLLFFIILFSNLLGLFLEFFLPIFGHGMEHYVKIPTADINFNVAMAIIGVLIVLYEQFKFLGIGKGLYEYFPLLGKNYIPYERGKLPKYIDLPLFILIKIFDIIISLFLGVLEIIGHFAKIISLSFRLFGNVTSGGLLLGMLFAATVALTGFVENITGVAGDGFPIIFPIIVYFQELLVSFIQALVFPLLIAIFVKVAKVH